ncbi:MAG: pyrroloquinoline quinone precursor peptide PqqA [Alphaproteobacteria bacterium]|nr:pyrroloquinoline quinone precursor peptide PqqA [Alphaproteobacteria bacterium]
MPVEEARISDLAWRTTAFGTLASTLRLEPDCSPTLTRRGDPMKTWRKPQVREISAAMEINCYASAE